MKTNQHFEKILNTLTPEALTVYAQKLPAECVDLLKIAARASGNSLEVEMVSRLFATLIEPSAFGLDGVCEQILNHTFTTDEAFAECKRNHEHWLYPYEIQKLRLFLELKTRLPRRIKENFVVIDVKAETQRILAEWAEEAKVRNRNKNKDNKNNSGDEE